MLSKSRQLLGQVSGTRMQICSLGMLESSCLVLAKRQFPRVLFCSASRVSVSRARESFPKKLRFVTTLVITGRMPRSGIAKKITHLAAEWRNIIFGFRNESGQGRLLRELVPSG